MELFLKPEGFNLDWALARAPHNQTIGEFMDLHGIQYIISKMPVPVPESPPTHIQFAGRLDDEDSYYRTPFIPGRLLPPSEPKASSVPQPLGHDDERSSLRRLLQDSIPAEAIPRYDDQARLYAEGHEAHFSIEGSITLLPTGQQPPHPRLFNPPGVENIYPRPNEEGDLL